MTRVLIIALTPALRAGLQTMLTATDLEVVGEAATLDQLAAQDLADVDVVVVADDDLPTDIARMTAGHRPLSFVVLSHRPQTAAVLRGLALRSWGIVAPDAPATALRAVVRTVAEGLIVLPPTLLEQVLTSSPAVEERELEPLDEPLTAREQEVLELLGQGLPNKLIARALNISEHTVKFHVSSIYTKLGASSRTEAVSRGARRGLITL